MKYFCFYDSQVDRRTISMAAINKINYVCSALNSNGCDVEIISCAMEAGEASDQGIEVINDKTNVFYFKTVKKSGNKVMRAIHRLRRNIKWLAFLITNIERNETLVVYHSLDNMRAVYLAKKIKGFKLLLEVEEIYNDVYIRSKASKDMEKRYFAMADAYIFSTMLLEKEINTTDKPYIIVYGAYETRKYERNISIDNRRHLVYSGTFDPNKGGLRTALGVAKYLDGSYCLHILGKCSQEVENYLMECIENNNDNNMCEIRYDGLLSGKEYSQYLQNCDIGLSTQNPHADFNNTSFPSKVISYLANNLRVVTYPIPVLTESELSDYLYYYNEDNPKVIADAIKTIDYNSQYDSIELIENLNKKFVNELATVIDALKSEY